MKRIVAIGGLFLVFVPLIVSAQTDTNLLNDQCTITEWDKAIKLQFEIPNVTYQHQGSYYIKDLGCYIVGLYRYFAGVAGILTIVFVMYGGVRYVVSMGNQQKVAQAKDTITSALMGLLLVLGSYAILYFINPNLTTFSLDLGAGIPTISEDTVWCAGDDLTIEGHGRGCGEQGLRKGTNETCIWPGDCGASGKICAFVGTGNGYDCIQPQYACEELAKNSAQCRVVDQAMAIAGMDSAVCSVSTTVLNAGTSNVTTIEKCVFGEVLSCDNGLTRVDCGFGEGYTACANEADVPRSISENTGPAGEFSGSRKKEYICTDARATEGVDSICCANIPQVDCAYPWSQTNPASEPTFQFKLPHDCNNDQAMISNCQLPDGTSILKDGAKYPNSCTPAEVALGAVCCVDLKLQNR